MSERIRCDTCKWFRVHFTQLNIGSCAHSPPTAFATDIQGSIHTGETRTVHCGGFPQVSSSMSCGQWMSKDIPYPWEEDKPSEDAPSFSLPAPIDAMTPIYDYIRESVRQNKERCEHELRTIICDLIRKELLEQPR